MLQSFYHFNICVRDMARSLIFYQRLGFSLREEVRPRAVNIAPHLGLNVNALRAAILVLEGHETPMLDLVEFIDPPAAAPPYAALNCLGIARVSFEVSNFDQALSELRDMNVEFVGPDVRYLGPGGRPLRTVCFYDPDRTVLQLIGEA